MAALAPHPSKPVHTDIEFIRKPLPPHATTAGAFGFVNCEDAVCEGYGYPHQRVQSSLLAAFNKPSLMAGIVDLFTDDELSMAARVFHTVTHFHIVSMANKPLANTSRLLQALS